MVNVILRPGQLYLDFNKEVLLMDFLKNIAALIKVKTLVTIAVMAVFMTLALRGDISADNAMIVISMVISFYFGTQSRKE